MKRRIALLTLAALLGVLACNRSDSQTPPVGASTSTLTLGESQGRHACEPPVVMPVPVPLPADGVGTGALHVIGDVELDFPLKHTKVDATISGSVTRVEVTQVFTNPYEETIEAVYVFPLPHEAAVTDLEMRLGERVIRGLVERREEARRIYENARDAGQVAALLEQERPNIFTQSVANILPGTEIHIVLTYVETLEYERGNYELVFPMVVGPRYNPPAATGEIVTAGAGTPPISSVPDAHRINPPFLPPSVRSGHDIELHVRLDAGVPLSRIESPSHAVQIVRASESEATVDLSELDDIPNKDFVLRYRIDGEGPEAGVLTHHDGEQGYLALHLLPKVEALAREITPKEMIFVLDCSGSMSGEPLGAAKTLVRHALTNMNPGDAFQIIRFSTNASGLSPVPLASSSENVRRGIAYVNQLSGGGGTQMIEGIKAALDTPRDPARLRIVMFLTDGYIGNENEILAAVRDRIGGARLFSFGVGSSVNRFLLERLGEEGRGEVQYVLPGSDTRAEVSTFYERIRNPYLTDIELVWNGVEVQDVYPARVPDLFQGKPLVVHTRYADGGRGWLEVKGNIAGRPWSKRIRVDLPDRSSGNPAIGSLWARARISDLERDMIRGERPGLVEEVTQLGLRHHLITKYTSFVAVEERLVVSDGRPKTVRVPVEMPAGVSYEGVFGSDLQAGKAGGMAFRQSSRAGVSFGLMSAAPGRVADKKSEALRSLGYVAECEVPAERDERIDGPATPGVTGREWSSQDGAEALLLRIAATRSGFAPGEPIEIEVTLTNRSAVEIRLPEAWSTGQGALRFRAIDTAWRETILEPEPAAPGVAPLSSLPRVLRPGETVTVQVRVNPPASGGFQTGGTLHLILDGTLLAARDSNRITVRILAPR